MGRPAKPATKPGKRTPGSFKAILTRLDADGWRALRLLAAERDTTLNALAIEAFNDLLKKYGKRQSVENPLLD
jgi:Antitoxin-like ribbon-helix-helix